MTALIAIAVVWLIAVALTVLIAKVSGLPIRRFFIASLLSGPGAAISAYRVSQVNIVHQPRMITERASTHLDTHSYEPPVVNEPDERAVIPSFRPSLPAPFIGLDDQDERLLSIDADAPSHESVPAPEDPDPEPEIVIESAWTTRDGKPLTTPAGGPEGMSDLARIITAEHPVKSRARGTSSRPGQELARIPRTAETHPIPPGEPTSGICSACGQQSYADIYGMCVLCLERWPVSIHAEDAGMDLPPSTTAGVARLAADQTSGEAAQG